MAVNKVIYDGSAIIDLTSDTVTADKVLTGYTAHDKSGASIVGTYNPFTPQIIVITDSGNYLTCSKSGESTLYGIASEGAYVFEVPSYGTWTITASVPNTSFSESASVNVTVVKQYVLELSAIPPFGDASWSMIQSFAQSGKAADVWQVGDTKTYQDTSGNTRTVEIVDIGDSSMVLDLADLYASGALAVQTGPTSGYTINWPTETFLPSLPQDFKSVVTSSTYFSSAEIFDTAPLQLFSTASGRIKGVAWWTNTTAQSGSMPSSTYNYYVTTSGTQSSDRMTNSHYYNAKITIS